METQNSGPVTFDHIPTPAELASVYSDTEADDPRSIFYKRVLVRPRIPVGWILFLLILSAVSCTLVAMTIVHFLHNALFAVFGCLLTFLLIFLVFAKRILICMVMLYQAWAPEKLRQRCRYEPSCSQYMLLAVEKYGFYKGLKKGLTRWKGCKPPNGGYDLP